MRPLNVKIAAALVALVLTSAASCDDTPDVSLAAVSRSTVAEVVDAPATVTARAAATLTAAANGTLAELRVAPGDKVEVGQVVAVVDSAEAQNRLAQATTALNAAKRAGGGSSKVDLSGVQRQLDAAAAEAFADARAAAEHISDPHVKDALIAQIGQAEQRYAVASESVAQATRAVEKGLASLGSALKTLGAAQVLQAQQAYDLAKSTVDALTLKAPIAGIVQLGGTSSAPSSAGDISSLLGGLTGGAAPATGGGSKPVGVSDNTPVGMPITAGTAVVTIVDVSELSLVAEVDETDILLVKPGVLADAELDAAPGETYPAKVTAVDVLPTSNSRGAVAYRVHLSLTAAESAPTPRPGMSAVVKLKVRQADNAVTVPAAAVFTVDGQDVVWVRDTSGKALKRKVRVGVSGQDVLQIVDGLAEGEQVVVHGADKVHDGDTLPS